MIIAEIIAALTVETHEFQREALESAIAQREEITPELLRLLEEDIVRIAFVADTPDYMGHLYAMYLLAQFREPRAYPLIVKFFSEDSKLVSDAVGETMADGLGQLLASTCDGDISLIKQMIEDSTIDEYARSSAIDALVILVVQGVISREEIMSYFASLFHGKLERKCNFTWSALIGACCDLYPEELMSDIEQTFEDLLIDTCLVVMEDFEANLAKGKEKTLAELALDQNKAFVKDTIAEMEGWGCFHMSNYNVSESLPEGVLAPERIGPKVGRNEPCPCGSGKKYKRCCGV